MCLPKTSEVLKLYRSLLRYGQTLQFTDKNYFKNRVTSEFKRNKVLSDEKGIKFYYERGQAVLSQKRIL
ncbi:MIEF1 upstream open reading frame protein [Cimex lectularius]|uniref:Complex 1 LYR protein domain-containing protein n=1 Tax=Cimex lectularius TaxID=79782 RepID=A0A8I6SH70_CIMLE|nr:MIEF1 upstream open reading frame protein [Cimex lectularius]